MSDYTDYENNLAFRPEGDWADTGITTGTTDRTQSSLQLVDQIEALNKYLQQKEDHIERLEQRIERLKILLSTCKDIILHSYPAAEFTNLINKITIEL